MDANTKNDLGIYEGCYAALGDGSFTGRLEQDVPYFRKIWKEKGANRWWNADGSVYHQNQKGGAIIRVLTPAEALKPLITSDSIQIEPKTTQSIPPHVLTAAMDAGIKAVPAYEDFVRAILAEGFAQMGSVVTGDAKAPLDMEALCEEISSAMKDNRGYLERSETAQQTIRTVAERAVAFIGRHETPKNESDSRNRDSENAKGGLSDLGDKIASPTYSSVHQSLSKDWEEIKSNANRRIPSVEHINDTIRAAASEWRKNNPGEIAPSKYIAEKIHAALGGVGLRVVDTKPPIDLHGVIVNVLRDDPQVRDISSLTARLVQAINKASGLCVDEGCPHHGEPHVCIDTTRGEKIIAELLRKGLTR